MQKYTLKNELETIKLAEAFAEQIAPGDFIALNGDLGSGKTFFVKAALKKLNVFNAASPTFAIVNSYLGKHKIYHFDFYRIKKAEELLDIGIHDYINDDDAIIFAEWSGLFPQILPKKRFEINFTIINDAEREISIEVKR